VSGDDKPRARRAAGFLAGSAIAALLAATATGASEALIDGLSPLLLLAATGFVIMLAAPPGFVLVCVGRLVWRGWRPAELVAAARDADTGGAPRLAAWVAFLALAAFSLAALTLQSMILVARASASLVVHVLAAPIAAIAVAALLAALSRPTVNGLARVAASVDRRVHRRLGRSLMTPPWLVGLALAIALGLGALGWWIGVQPLIGHLDLSFAPSLALGLALLAGGPALWARARRRTAPVLALVVVSAAALGAAAWLRQGRPLAMLTIWGRSQISGLAIDRLFEVEELRGEMDPEGIRPSPRAGAPPRDVVLVTIDTVRADHTPPYGGAARMPALARLARQGAVFEWALSPGNVTRRSLPSMMIGVSAPRVAGRVAGWALRLDPRHVLLAERLRAAGYDTAGFFCCASHFGREHDLGLIRGISHVAIEHDGERLAGMAARWLAARDGRAGARPLFLWLHLIEPHAWEVDHPAAAGAQRYDLALAAADRALGIALEAAWTPARRARTYVVVTSDHGEGLGEHGHRNHASSLYNSEIHVPLVVAGPAVGPRRIAQPVGLADLAPTILDLAGFTPPRMPSMDGASFGPLLRGGGGGAAALGEAYSAMIEDRSVGASSRALVVGRHKLIWHESGAELELYDLAVDPDERHNLVDRVPALQAALRARLAARRRGEQVSPF
jgi:hypothetical protein